MVGIDFTKQERQVTEMQRNISIPKLALMAVVFVMFLIGVPLIARPTQKEVKVNTQFMPSSDTMK